MGEPLFAAFFKDQAEVKREHAKQLLRYLRKCEGKICLLVIKRLIEIPGEPAGKRQSPSAVGEQVKQAPARPEDQGYYQQ